jgi:arginase
MKLQRYPKRKQKMGIIGYPMDLGADRRGVDMGPSALRFSNLENKLDCLGYIVKDFGDIFIEGAETQVIRNPSLNTFPKLSAHQKYLQKNRKPVKQELFAFDSWRRPCDSNRKYYRISSFAEEKKTLGVVWIDAHADMNTPETTTIR